MMKIRTFPREEIGTAYQEINENAEAIVGQIQQKHVEEYSWLLDNLEKVNEPGYQQRYKAYWGMNVARLSDEYYQAYFRYLWDKRCLNVEVKELAYTLYETPVKYDKQKVQFSFCSKLCHMQNQQLPIYDSAVREFYGFKPPYNTSPHRRIDSLVVLYDYLIQEYNRILDENLLGQSISTFRDRLNADCFSDIKVIDSLIWAYQLKRKRS